ncbi:MAG: Glu/Leu/Phe/Val dehydrogenase dimerization domain-containing protein [Solirubrobacteraceae bacterium]
MWLIERRTRARRRPRASTRVALFRCPSDRLGIPEGLRSVVRTVERAVQVKIAVELRDAGIHVFSGYRIQNNGARGAYKGDIQYRERVAAGEVPERDWSLGWDLER